MSNEPSSLVHTAAPERESLERGGQRREIIGVVFGMVYSERYVEDM